VNNLLILVLSKAAALFPLSKKPDFIISLGTGKLYNIDLLKKVSDNTQQKSILYKLGKAF
jgi:hypothetical protein